MKNSNKGITIIALVITIVVMFILVGVTINITVKGSLFNYAGRASSETNKAIQAEQEMLDFKENLTSEQFNFKLETNGYTASLYGDANCDGKKNNKDVTRLMRYVKYREPDLMTPVGKLNGDVFHDGVLDMKDYLVLANNIKYGEPEIPCTFEIKYGDCNQDGRVNTSDVTLLAQFIESGSDLTYMAQINADVNADGLIDNDDLDILAEYIKSRGAFSLPKKK